MLKKIDDRLFLIGVAHVLPKSATEVGEVIERERPDIVAVELCPVRYLALTRPEKQPGVVETARAGPKPILLGTLLNLLQGKFSRQTGMPAGEEMLVAIEHARQIGARIELIDQDIGLTLQRLVDRMSLREKFRLFVEMLAALLPTGKRVDIKRLTDEQVVWHLLEELKRTTPNVYDVLIRERDEHMASRLAMLMAEGAKVACVVGAGHVPGISERLSEGVKGGWRVSLRYDVGG